MQETGCAQVMNFLFYLLFSYFYDILSISHLISMYDYYIYMCWNNIHFDQAARYFDQSWSKSVKSWSYLVKCYILLWIFWIWSSLINFHQVGAIKVGKFTRLIFWLKFCTRLEMVFGRGQGGMGLVTMGIVFTIILL